MAFAGGADTKAAPAGGATIDVGSAAGGAVTTGGAAATGAGPTGDLISGSLLWGTTKLPLAFDGIGALPWVAKLLVSSGTGI